MDGATYTDVHARVPVRYLLMVLTAFAGAAVIASAFLSTSYRVPAVALGGMAVAGILGGFIYPSFVQTAQVRPERAARRKSSTSRGTSAVTRLAYGLDAVEETNFPARVELTAAEIDANTETTKNVRVWDPVPLLDTFNQIQSIRPFYVFNDIDVDRYMRRRRRSDRSCSACASSTSDASEANWTRERLQLTHGFGAVITPVNESRDEGLPVLLTRDIPPVGDDIPVSIEGARVYFGERTDHYVVVRTNVPEFDYPARAKASRETRYEPDRGIRLSSCLRKAALAWELGDINLLISGQLGADSRVLMHRQLQRPRSRRWRRSSRSTPTRTRSSSMGSIYWIQDAYTSSGRFPYSQHRGGTNYIRNSVKIVTNALTGDMTFYLMQPDDPIAATWAKIFPDLFTPGSGDARGAARAPALPGGAVPACSRTSTCGTTSPTRACSSWVRTSGTSRCTARRQRRGAARAVLPDDEAAGRDGRGVRDRHAVHACGTSRTRWAGSRAAPTRSTTASCARTASRRTRSCTGRRRSRRASTRRRASRSS